MSHQDVLKIIRVPSSLVAKIINYLPTVEYETFSRKQNKFVIRNCFSLYKVEAGKEESVLWIEIFGREKGRRFDDLKKFVNDLEKLLKERNKKCDQE